MTVENGIPRTTVSQVIEAGRRLLFSALDEIEGQKTLVWESREMMRQVNLYAGFTQLQEHGIVKMLALYNKDMEATSSHVIYLLTPSVSAVETFINYMLKTNNENSLNYIYFIPEDWYLARQTLKECEAVSSRIEWIRPLPLLWLPSPVDVITLNIPDLHSRVLLSGKWTYLHKCAVALEQLDSWCMRPVTLHAKGKWSEQVLDMVLKMKNKQEDRNTMMVNSPMSVNRIVIIDRWLDPITPLLTQITYSGLLAEVYDYNLNGSITVPRTSFEQSDKDADTKDKDLHVSLPDEVFDRIKHAHFRAFANEISPILREIREDEEIDRQKMSVAELQVLVRKLPLITKRKNLSSQHMRLAEMLEEPFYERFVDTICVEKEIMSMDGEKGDKVNSFIEEAIINSRPLNEPLRLIALQSLCAGGLKPITLQTYDRLILHTYGITGMTKMLKMRKIGLIKEKGGARMQCLNYAAPQWPILKKSQRLLVSETDELSMGDLSAPYSGYIPLLVRTVEEGLAVNFAGWHTAREDSKSNSSHNTVVMVIGGVTPGEAACFKRLPNISLLASSDVTNGNRLLDFITNIVD